MESRCCMDRGGIDHDRGLLLELRHSQLPPDQISPLHHPVFQPKFCFSLGMCGQAAGDPALAYCDPEPLLPWDDQSADRHAWRCDLRGVGACDHQDWYREYRGRPEPLGVALILVGPGFDLLTVIGRGLHRYAGVSASRYTTFNMLALVGAYLVVISRPIPDPGQVRESGDQVEPLSCVHGGAGRLVQSFRPAIRALPAIVIACMIFVIVLATRTGFPGLGRIT